MYLLPKSVTSISRLLPAVRNLLFCFGQFSSCVNGLLEMESVFSLVQTHHLTLACVCVCTSYIHAGSGVLPPPPGDSSATLYGSQRNAPQPGMLLTLTLNSPPHRQYMLLFQTGRDTATYTHRSQDISSNYSYCKQRIVLLFIIIYCYYGYNTCSWCSVGSL